MKHVSAVLRDIFDMLIGILLFGILFTVFCKMLASPILLSDAASEEVGVERARSPVEASCAETEEIPEEKSPCVLTVYREGDGPAPEWYRPDEEMAVEWTDDMGEIWGEYGGDMEAHPPVGISPGGVDWNVCSSLVGWDGRLLEIWELDLWSRVFYIEFWGSSDECCAAGCDAMLNLWASGEYGQTMFECLSYYDPIYGYTYEVYPWVWDWNYDLDGLAWCKEFCRDRFLSGPTWVDAMYFQLGRYHDSSWTIPLYELDGVYFSAGR